MRALSLGSLYPNIILSSRPSSIYRGQSRLAASYYLCLCLRCLVLCGPSQSSICLLYLYPCATYSTYILVLISFFSIQFLSIDCMFGAFLVSYIPNMNGFLWGMQLPLF
jgi:hypothetical protein